MYITCEGELTIDTLERSINLKEQYVEVNIKLLAIVSPRKTANHFTLCTINELAQNEAFFQASYYKDDESEDISVTGYDSFYKAKGDGIMCKKVKFPEMYENETIQLVIKSIYVRVLNPIPKSITQFEKQKVLYEDTLYTLLPYVTKEQITEIQLPDDNVIYFTKSRNAEKVGDKIKYGPFYDIKELNKEPLKLHFIHESPFIEALHCVREIQISLWGNIYIEENYYLVNAAASHSGQWSRLEFIKNAEGQKSALLQMYALLQSNAHSIYFRDEIGNISTSHIHKSEKGVFVALAPRYPLFGGWKTKFVFGDTLSYSIPLRGALWKRSDGFHQIKMNFGPEISDIIIDDMEMRIVLPEGSTNIKYHYPYDVDVEYDTKYWYFDTIGRPVLVLKLKDMVPDHHHELIVNYKPSAFSIWRKLLLFIGVIFSFFVLSMIYFRFDLQITYVENSVKKD